MYHYSFPGAPNAHLLHSQGAFSLHLSYSICTSAISTPHWGGGMTPVQNLSVCLGSCLQVISNEWQHCCGSTTGCDGGSQRIARWRQTKVEGGGSEGVSSRTSERRVAAEPARLSHLLSVCLLSVLFSLSQESNDFSTVLFPNLHRHLPSTLFSSLFLPFYCSATFPQLSFLSIASHFPLTQ